MAKASSSLMANISETVVKATSDIIHGVHPAHIDFGKVDGGVPPSLVGTGAAIFMDQNHANSITPDTRNIVAMSPEATILVKKKVFSSLKSQNDLRFMDKTEKMLLRSTKALFAYKIQQIRAYESLTKFENFMSDNQMYSMNLLSSLIREGSLIDLSKIGQTVDEYVSKKLEAWLSEEMSQWMATDDGTQITFDPNTGEIKSAPTRGNQIITGGRSSLTNGEYLKSIPSSQSKLILDNKKSEFRAQY